MKWLKRIGLVLLAIVVLILAIPLFLPSGYNVERSVTVNAEPEQIHELVGDLERWPEWTPWLELDPSIQTVYGDTTTGFGAHQEWSGDSGSGELTFTKSDAATGITYDLSFDQGKYRSEGSISYESAPGGTNVTWSMNGEMSYLGRYFGVMMNSMVGPAFEKGLEKLKSVAEAMPEPETETETGEGETVSGESQETG